MHHSTFFNLKDEYIPSLVLGVKTLQYCYRLQFFFFNYFLLEPPRITHNFFFFVFNLAPKIEIFFFHLCMISTFS